MKYNPSRINPLIESIDIQRNFNIDGNPISLHVIFNIINCKGYDTCHIYFRDIDFSQEQLRRIAREFKMLKDFFEHEGGMPV